MPPGVCSALTRTPSDASLPPNHKANEGGTMTLEGKVAVVTGGGSGIGEAICVRLARDGAKVAVVDLNESAAKLTAKLPAAASRSRPTCRQRRGRRRARRRRGAARAGRHLGQQRRRGPGAEYADRVKARAEQQIAEWRRARSPRRSRRSSGWTTRSGRRMLAVHLDGTFYGTRAAARSMAPRGTGAIVNIASICGIEGCTGHPHYSAAKGGIVGFTRAVAKELILQGVRVNSVAPGYVDTPLLATGLTDTLTAVVRALARRRAGSAVRTRSPRRSPSSRPTTPSFFVGQNVSPNGGLVTV